MSDMVKVTVGLIAWPLTLMVLMFAALVLLNS
jgi:hypothetical protein